MSSDDMKSRMGIREFQSNPEESLIRSKQVRKGLGFVERSKPPSK